MSALEFAQWQVMYELEGFNPESRRLQHATLLAATMQGASTRKDRKPWSAAHFLGPDPWAPPSSQSSASRGPSVVDQVKAMNARRRGRH
ncbi:hypothetical protein [Variovorax sp. DAIF25]|uniref:hypothetical protein n=1 Tax=Variovorax sp. DAIF25 TaxID=3080983 RepID=UPI003D6A4975